MQTLENALLGGTGTGLGDAAVQAARRRGRVPCFQVRPGHPFSPSFLPFPPQRGSRFTSGFNFEGLISAVYHSDK